MPSKAGEGAPTTSSLKLTVLEPVADGWGAVAEAEADAAALDAGGAADNIGPFALAAGGVVAGCGAAVDAGRSQLSRPTSAQSKMVVPTSFIA